MKAVELTSVCMTSKGATNTKLFNGMCAEVLFPSLGAGGYRYCGHLGAHKNDRTLALIA